MLHVYFLNPETLSSNTFIIMVKATNVPMPLPRLVKMTTCNIQITYFTRPHWQELFSEKDLRITLACRENPKNN
jgi:hypothetical protein